MQVEFERLIQIINPEYVVSKKIDSDTIFYFIKAAQDRYIKQNYLAIEGSRGTHEALRKNTDAFKALIKTTSFSVGPIDGSGKSTISLPSDFFLYLRSSTKVYGTYLQIGVANAAWVSNKFITQDDVEGISISYFNNPILRQPCILINNAAFDIYYDAMTTPIAAEMTYIKAPVAPSPTVNCELAENVHQEIVELAVDIFITEAAYRLSSSPANNER